MEWTKNINNEVLAGDGFYISYNPSIKANPFDSVLVGLGEAESRVGLDETALCVEDSTNPMGRCFLILNGDFRKDYEEAFPLGKEACIAVYEKYREEYRSDFTNTDK